MAKSTVLNDLGREPINELLVVLVKIRLVKILIPPQLGS